MLSIIIPVFNQAKYTKECLEALFATCGDYSSYEIIIIDNASTDETSQIIAELKLKMPIQYIRSEINLGFTLASNLGAKHAKGSNLLFLNNDTIPLQNWRKLLEDNLLDSKIGIVGPRLLYPNTRQINHAGYVYNPAVGFYPIYHNSPEDFLGVLKKRSFQALLGACLMMRKETFEKLNGFSVFGLEDIDLCLRTHELNLKVVYIPEAIVLHHGSITQQNSAPGTFPVYTNAKFQERWGTKLIWDDYNYYNEDGVLDSDPKTWNTFNAILKDRLND